MGITFDLDGFITALNARMVKEMASIENDIIVEVNSQYAQSPNLLNSINKLIGDNYKVTPGPVYTEGSSAFADLIGSNVTLMLEWGRGSSMDFSNPGLPSYLDSPMWNPARQDLYIRSRPDTLGQIDIFGRTVRGKGAGGVNLEPLGGNYAPWEPIHAMLEASIRWSAGAADERLAGAVNKFNFNRYIHTTKKSR